MPDNICSHTTGVVGAISVLSIEIHIYLMPWDLIQIHVKNIMLIGTKHQQYASTNNYIQNYCLDFRVQHTLDIINLT